MEQDELLVAKTNIPLLSKSADMIVTRKAATCFFIGLIIFALGACKPKPTGITVVFAQPETPLRITKDGKEHLFASYYGINSWSANQRYVTVLETDIKDSLPDENDPATLGLVDLETNRFIHCRWSPKGDMIGFNSTYAGSRQVYVIKLN